MKSTRERKDKGNAERLGTADLWAGGFVARRSQPHFRGCSLLAPRLRSKSLAAPSASPGELPSVDHIERGMKTPYLTGGRRVNGGACARVLADGHDGEGRRGTGRLYPGHRRGVGMGLHRLVTPCNGLYRVFRGHIYFLEVLAHGQYWRQTQACVWIGRWMFHG